MLAYTGIKAVLGTILVAEVIDLGVDLYTGIMDQKLVKRQMVSYGVMTLVAVGVSLANTALIIHNIKETRN